MSDIVKAIDVKLESEQGSHRAHLGASQIGKACERQIVYDFRHALPKQFTGRLLRLFNRGHREEARFVGYLRSIGIEVQDFTEKLVYNEQYHGYETIPWDDPVEADCFDASTSEYHLALAVELGLAPKQWGFKEYGGHFAGSTDGQACTSTSFKDLPLNEWFLTEFKTHNSVSFVKTQLEGVQKAKPEHYAQMQIYMHERGLKHALYMFVNKNDDDMDTQIIAYDETFALELLAKALRIISARQLPPRISTSPSWFACKFCDYRSVCHYGEPMQKKCRTCKNSVAVDDAQWYCSKWASNIPKEVQPVGCDAFEEMTD